MIGVALGAYGMHYTPDYPALQLAGLFGTTLAPIAGHFGWLPGILAGFIHSALCCKPAARSRIEPVQQRLFRRTDCHCPLSHHHRHLEASAAGTAG